MIPELTTENPIGEQTLKESTLSSESLVKLWTSRVRAAKQYFDKDFKRIRQDMEFAAGYQWIGQDVPDDDRYTVNLVLRFISNKVSSLYARNPTVEAKRRKRMDFEVWDGRMESLQQAAALLAHPEALPEDKVLATALMADFTNGRQQKDLVDKVCKTLEILFNWQLDSQTPDFKKQMKHLVRRAVTCGVAFVRPNYSCDDVDYISTSETKSTITDRVKRGIFLQTKLEESTIEEDSATSEEIDVLKASVAASIDDGELQDVEQKITFDFPPVTSIIIDPACRSIDDFVGAKWVAQEYLLPLDEVNAFFETNITITSDIVQYNNQGQQTISGVSNPEDTKTSCPLVCVWEIFSLTDKSSLFICDGYKEFLREPSPVTPCTKRFWPLHTIVFNAIETEPGQQKASIYPPSDVSLLRSAQKEWNRDREALREQRKANAPKYLTQKGRLSQNDKESLRTAEPNSVLELETADADVSKLLVPFQHAPIDPLAYDTAPIMQDMFMVQGTEDGPTPASSKSTATAATINEQSRMQVSSSNIDDLDDFLSGLAEACGEIMLKEFTPETVKRIVGPGAVWPIVDKQDYLDSVFLQVKASSSGRPNKALEISNFQQLAPIALQAGASPQWVLRELIRRLDDRTDPDDIFPTNAGVLPMQPTVFQQSAQSALPPSGGPQPTRQNQFPSEPQIPKTI